MSSYQVQNKTSPSQQGATITNTACLHRHRYRLPSRPQSTPLSRRAQDVIIVIKTYRSHWMRSKTCPAAESFPMSPPHSPTLCELLLSALASFFCGIIISKNLFRWVPSLFEELSSCNNNRLNGDECYGVDFHYVAWKIFSCSLRCQIWWHISYSERCT